MERQVSEELAELTRPLLGGVMELRQVSLGGLKPAKKNARWMTEKQIARLSKNIRRDGALSSIPLTYEGEDGQLVLISGHQRVKAALGAGLERGLVLVWLGDKSESRITALQLSHNSIVGQDDEETLYELVKRLTGEDLDYAAVEMPELADISLDDLGPVEIAAVKVINLCFLDVDYATVEEALERIWASSAFGELVAACQYSMEKVKLFMDVKARLGKLVKYGLDKMLIILARKILMMGEEELDALLEEEKKFN